MVKEINQAEFQAEVLDSAIPVLVDFWAPWCGPCRMMAPILEDVAKQLGSSLKVAKVNTDENSDLAIQHNISSIPCLILFKNGQEAARFVGVQQPASAFVEKLKAQI